LLVLARHYIFKGWGDADMLITVQLFNLRLSKGYLGLNYRAFADSYDKLT